MSDCSYKDEITCPYCGWEDGDSWESLEDGEMECGECEKTFAYTSEREIHYTSYCTDGNHKFVHTPHPTIEDCYSCEYCDASEFKDHLLKRVADMEKRAIECAGDEDKMLYINHSLTEARAKLSQLPTN